MIRQLPRAATLIAAGLCTLSSPPAESACEKDVAFALPELEKRCGRFFELKQIDWKKVSAEMKGAAKQAKGESEHLRVLMRLVARLRDGHAEVRALEAGKRVKAPDDLVAPRVSPGLFFCKVGGKLHVKSAFGPAAGAGIKAGMEVVKIEGKPALAWMEARVTELADYECFSTEQQGFFHACHQGLRFPKGEKLELELVDLSGKALKRSIACGDVNQVPSGPAFLPEKLATTKDLKYGKTAGGFGYVHVRRSPDDLPQQMDAALEGLGRVPGLVLDFRGNSGGSFDHDAFMGRFVPSGRTIAFGKQYASAGPDPYGGPIVVIIDATVRSAGETASGIFKEDGRAYLIGESATAGMSSTKETLDLPSGLFQLYFSVGSNKGRFNDGKGIEGIGVPPHEISTFDPKDLAAGRDTLIARADELLKKFPQQKVPYDPGAFGWK